MRLTRVALLVVAVFGALMFGIALLFALGAAMTAFQVNDPRAGVVLLLGTLTEVGSVLAVGAVAARRSTSRAPAIRVIAVTVWLWVIVDWTWIIFAATHQIL
jgi:hypothetical protein